VESFMGLLVSRVPLAERMFPGTDHTLHCFTQIFKRVLDLVSVVTLRLFDCCRKNVHGVVALRSGNWRRDTRHVVSLVVTLDETPGLGCNGFLDEGLRHQRAIAVLARIVDVRSEEHTSELQ